jgi:hypothetical protein
MKAAAITSFLALLWLAGAAAAAEPAPPAPIKPAGGDKAEHERWGYVILSSGERIDGLVSTTRAKPIRIFDRKKSSDRDIPWAKIESIEQIPDEEWFEQEWRWKEGGSDEKVFTDRYYGAAKYRTDLTLKDGEKIVGDAVAPVFVKAGEKRHLLTLYKRLKSEQPALKKDLPPLVYIKKLVLTDEPPKPKEQE